MAYFWWPLRIKNQTQAFYSTLDIDLFSLVLKWTSLGNCRTAAFPIEAAMPDLGRFSRARFEASSRKRSENICSLPTPRKAHVFGYHPPTQQWGWRGKGELLTLVWNCSFFWRLRQWLMQQTVKTKNCVCSLAELWNIWMKRSVGEAAWHITASPQWLGGKELRFS